VLRICQPRIQRNLYEHLRRPFPKRHFAPIEHLEPLAVRQFALGFDQQTSNIQDGIDAILPTRANS